MKFSYPRVFMLGRMKLTRLPGSIVHNLASASGLELLWSGHVVSFAWKETNPPLELAFQIKNN